jgi:solute:Na+ symporter, SSS family
VINKLFEFAGYTYGPLLALYAFGLFTKWQIKGQMGAVDRSGLTCPLLLNKHKQPAVVWF